MAELLIPLNLCITPTYFLKDNCTTWTNNITKMKETTNRNHTIDYILTRKEDLKHVRDSIVVTEITPPSTDHFPNTLQFKTAKIIPKRKRKAPSNTRTPNIPSEPNETSNKRFIRRDLMAADENVKQEYNTQRANLLSHP